MKLPLTVGQSVQVLIPVGPRTVPCVAVVVDVGERTFDTSRPYRHTLKIPVEVDQLTLTLTLPDAVYTFRCPVVKVNEEGVTLGMPEPEEVQRVQRREFVRVPTSLEVLVEPELELDSLAFGPPFKAPLADISGGGCSLVSPVEIKRGDRLRVTMDLPEEGVISLLGKVMRCAPIQTPKGQRYSCGLDFGSMVEGLRSKLVRYVFAMQREQARRVKNSREEP
jgi:c-di-GMP-binding flagellar brake protein YcgR